MSTVPSTKSYSVFILHHKYKYISPTQGAVSTTTSGDYHGSQFTVKASSKIDTLVYIVYISFSLFICLVFCCMTNQQSSSHSRRTLKINFYFTSWTCRPMTWASNHPRIVEKSIFLEYFRWRHTWLKNFHPWLSRAECLWLRNIY